jgi:hypothetical protein
LPSGLRDKLKWPFASTSIWNTPIGAQATSQAANIASNTHGGYPTEFVQDQDVIVMRPTAPALDVHVNNVGWNGGDRCPPQGGVLQTVHTPLDFTMPNSGENNSAAFLAADGVTVQQNQPFTRCTVGGGATALVTFNDVSITGPGITGAHGGSGLSALGGTIRVGEFTSGAIHHVMKVNLWAQDYYHCCSPFWPAVTVDGYANSTLYGGTNVHLGPGALLALPRSFSVGNLSTTPGKILAQAFKDYGAYVVDDTYWNAWAIATEQGPDGKVVDEFQMLYGYSMHASGTTPFMTDLKAVIGALEIVTNNASTTIGGPGARVVPPPPELGN